MGRQFGSLEQAGQSIRAKMLIVVAAQDKVVSPEAPSAFADRLNAPKVTLAGDCGHNAYKCEKEVLGPVLNRFLREP